MAAPPQPSRNQPARSKSAKSNEAPLEDDETPIASFWLSLLRSSAEETGIPEPDFIELSESLEKELDRQFEADISDEVYDLLTYDNTSLEDRIASENKGLKRDIRRSRKRQDLLAEEQERLEGFRPARKANEQDEANELSTRLHPLAQKFLSKKASTRQTISPHVLQTLGQAKRELESLEEGLLPYEPEEDNFLIDLLGRLKTPKAKKQKR